MKTKRLASIDLGTNTIRLLVADVALSAGEQDFSADAGLKCVHSLQRVTRLGEGLHVSGLLAQAAIERSAGAVSEFCRTAMECGAGRVVIAGTKAVRSALNADELIERVSSDTGITITVLPWEAEAALSLLGLTAGFGADGSLLLFDIGGGSTEFVLAENGGMKASAGTDLGVVRLAETHIRHDPPHATELGSMFAEIDSAVMAAVGKLGRNTAGARLVGTAGTVTTIAAMDIGLSEYDPWKVHGHVIPLGRVERMYEKIAGMRKSDIVSLPQIEPGREDLIAAGLAITVSVMRHGGKRELTVSEYGIREGIIVAMARGEL